MIVNASYSWLTITQRCVLTCCILLGISSCTHCQTITSCATLELAQYAFDGKPSIAPSDTIHLTLMDGFAGIVVVELNGANAWSGSLATDPSTSVAKHIKLLNKSNKCEILVRTQSKCVRLNVPHGYSRLQLYQLRSGWRAVLSNNPLSVQ